MTRWLLLRLLWLVLTLLGATFVTFVVLDRAPIDRAELQVLRGNDGHAVGDVESRDAAIQRLRIHYGMVDPVTLEPEPLWRRYGAWLANAATLRFAGPGEDDRALWRRVAQALPVTVLLNGLALLLAVAVGVPLGVWLGRRSGRTSDRGVSMVLLILAGVPQFLLATLVMLALSTVWLRLFPASGLRSVGAERFTFVWQLLDFGWHLVLPVAVVAIAPLVMVSRYVRDAVSRARRATFAVGMRALGVDDRTVSRRLLRHGATPVATLAGGLLPMLVSGSIVVENVFSLDGLGHLMFRAVLDQEHAMVMMLVLLTSLVTLLAMIASDLLHQLVDPRVRLQR